MLKKEYTYVHALHDVSFKIPDGAIVGYIGSNGAEKSSAIKIMSGILNPDNGECIIDGLSFRGKIGVKHYKSTGS